MFTDCFFPADSCQFFIGMIEKLDVPALIGDKKPHMFIICKILQDLQQDTGIEITQRKTIYVYRQTFQFFLKKGTHIINPKDLRQ